MPPNINIDTLTIGEAKDLLAKAGEVAAVLGQPAPGVSESQPAPREHGHCIIAADRGHVWVGTVTEQSGYYHVRQARCIRRWGTTRGLNQIANEGPTEGTILDDPADISVVARAVLYLIPTEASKWTG